MTGCDSESRWCFRTIKAAASDELGFVLSEIVFNDRKRFRIKMVLASDELGFVLSEIVFNDRKRFRIKMVLASDELGFVLPEIVFNDRKRFRIKMVLQDDSEVIHPPPAASDELSSKESSGDLVLACLGDKQLSGSVINTRLAVRKHRGGRQGQEYPFALRLVEAPEKDEDGDPITTMIVDWLPPGTSAAQQPLQPDDPWIAGCRQEEQRAGMARLKRAPMTVLAEHGVERPIPSATHVRNSSPTIENELRTRVAEAFYLYTPGDPRQTQHSRFQRARDRAEQRGLVSAGNMDDVTYLWLTRPDLEDDDAG
jgi:hypothetical protein